MISDKRALNSLYYIALYGNCHLLMRFHGERTIMSQQNNQQQPQRNPPGQDLRRNLYLDFPLPYQRQYERRADSSSGRPVQSGFVSSTSWSPGDATMYKAQTKYAPSERSSEPLQDRKVTCVQEEDANHFVRDLLSDF